MGDSQGVSRLLVVMRHSVRLDADPDATWGDRETRPYDSPIVDSELPGAAAARLEALGLTAIASSPFRRCLETAGVVARALGIGAVHVHFGLGELMHQVRACARGFERVEELEELVPLSDADADAALGAGVALASRVSGDVEWREGVDAGQARFLAALRGLAADHARLLVVTHGDLLAAAAADFLGPDAVVYDVRECGTLTIDVGGSPALRGSDRVLML